MNILYLFLLFLTHHGMAQDFGNLGKAPQQPLFSQGFPTLKANPIAVPGQKQATILPAPPQDHPSLMTVPVKPNIPQQLTSPSNPAPQQLPSKSANNPAPPPPQAPEPPALSQAVPAPAPVIEKQTFEAAQAKQQPVVAGVTANKQNIIGQQPADSGPNLISSPVKMGQEIDQLDDLQMPSMLENTENIGVAPLPSSLTREENFQKNPYPTKQDVVHKGKINEGLNDKLGLDDNLGINDKLGLDDNLGLDTLKLDDNLGLEDKQEVVQSSRVKEGLDDKLGYELKSIVSQIQDMQKEVADALKDGDDI